MDIASRDKKVEGKDVEYTYKKYKIGIKWKLFAIIAIFIVCALLCIWFFQFFMLNIFYQGSMFADLAASADEIVECLDNEDEVREQILENSSKYFFNIWLLRVKGNRGDILVEANGAGGAELSFLKYKIETMYSQAVANGGTYIATIPIEESENTFEFKVLEDNFGSKDSFPRITSYNGTIGTIYARIVNLDGREYMILQYSVLTPLNTTVTMLKRQFVVIGTVMLVMAIGWVVIMSRMITKPIINMNQAAKKLAKGNYDADFSGKGYSEIEELSESLNYAASELAKTDNLQKELISNISHDLRTPLTMIKGYSEIMRDIPGENTSENAQAIIDESERLSNLVNDMLDLSKIQAGARKPNIEEFSITQTVRETLGRYEKLVMQDGYKIDFAADEEVLVKADRGMILQVVYNLINNAINYTGEDKYVRVLQEVRANKVRISVTDTGEGISAEDLAQIWNRYYRVDKVHKRAAIGTGLGLSIVKEILEAHSAAFGVESAIGSGTTFWFEIERAPTPLVFDAEYDSIGD